MAGSHAEEDRTRQASTLPGIGGINVTISREIGENEIVKHKLLAADSSNAREMEVQIVFGN